MDYKLKNIKLLQWMQLNNEVPMQAANTLQTSNNHWIFEIKSKIEIWDAKAK